MASINHVSLTAPVQIGDVVIANVCGTGVNVVATRNMRNRPEDLKLVVVDPKRVEMGKYKDLPHLLCPIIKEPSQAKVCFQKLIDEMERRYTLFELSGVSNIRQFNTEYAPEAGFAKLPFIVVVVDEYADLVDTCKDIGDSVVRLAQKARAAGIHLVIATQRPSVQVITGVIKANLPVRVALSVSSAIDSMLKYPRVLFFCGFRLLWDYTFYLWRYARHPERTSIEARYARVRKLIHYILDHFRIDWKVEGIENLQALEKNNQCYLLVANHVSDLDPLAIVYLSEKPISFVAKKETRKMPFIGTAVKALDGYFMITFLSQRTLPRIKHISSAKSMRSRFKAVSFR